MNIKRLLNYEDSTDQEIYTDVELADLNLKIQACTVANSDGKPNEDAFSVVQIDNCLWVGMFDGTTSLKSIPALGNQSGARFASHFLKEALVQNVNKTELEPKELLTKLNSLLLGQAKQLGGTLSDTHSLPASMATIIRLDLENSLLKFAHIGDTYGLIKNLDGSTLIFTDDKNNRFDQEMFVLMEKIAKKKGLTIRQARQDEELKTALYEMFIRRNNNPNGLGSGLVNGDPSAKLYLQTDEYPIDDVESVLVATDGLEIQGKSILDSEFRKNIFEIIKVGGLKGLIKRKKDAEDRDPDWNYVRYKHSDDATGVYISFDK